MKKIFFPLVFVSAMFVVTCGKQIPNDIIQPTEMEALLYDYHLALAIGADLDYSERYKREGYRNYVFNKHGVTEAEFDSSMVWYTRHSEELTEIYKNLQQKFEMAEEQMRSEINKRSGQISVSLSGDSVDVWSDRDLYWLTSFPLTNRLSFDLKADTTFHKQDAIVFSGNFKFLNSGEVMPKAVLAMNITFKNDSTKGLTKVIDMSGYNELYIKPDTAYEYKNINGFVYFSNPDSIGASLLISNIKLMRYRDGSYENVILTDENKNIVMDTDKDNPRVLNLTVKKQEFMSEDNKVDSM